MSDATPKSRSQPPAQRAQVTDLVREVGEQLFEQLACLAQAAAAACGAQGAGWQLHQRQAIAGWIDVTAGLLTASSANDASTAGDTLVIPIGTGASQSAGVTLPSMAAPPDAAGVRTPVHLGGGEHVADLLLIGKPLPRDAGPRDATLCSLARMAALVIESALSRIARSQPASPGAEGDDLELRGKSGEARHVQVHSTAVRGEAGQFVRTRSAMVDISERHRSRQQLEALVREQHAMLNNDMVGIIRVRGRQVVWVNRAFERMFEYTADEIIGKSTRVLHPDGRAYVEQGRMAYPLLQALGTYRAQVRLVKKSGATLWADMSGSMLSIERDESLWMAQDITALQAQRESVESLAFQDSLTNLTNRAGFMRWMTRALHERAATGDLLALCFIDLDQFKPINDEHGHDAGDEVLGVIAQRLLQSIRADDLAVRLGGDEFLVVLPHASSREALRLVCQRLLSELRQPITFLNGTRVRVSASMGVSLCPDHATTTEGLLRCADEAMYLAKSSGRDNWRIFEGQG